MATPNGERGPQTPRPISALPSVQARAFAFGAILIAGACGGLIGYSTTNVGCTRACATPDGIGGVVGAVVAAGGVAVIVVLVLRAMGEWRSIKETHQMETMIAAAAEAVAGTAPFYVTAAPDPPEATLPLAPVEPRSDGEPPAPPGAIGASIDPTASDTPDTPPAADPGATSQAEGGPSEV